MPTPQQLTECGIQDTAVTGPATGPAATGLAGTKAESIGHAAAEDDQAPTEITAIQEMTPEILLPLQFEDMVVRPPNHDEMVSTMKSNEPPEAPSCAQQFSVPVMTSNTAPQVSTVYQNVSKLMR